MGVEYVGVREAVRALGKAGPELRKELRPQLRAAGSVIRNDMRSRSAYSSRIPGAIGMTLRFDARGGGIRFSVNAKRAPHARVLERGNLGGRATTFRHPVFGRDWWVSQATRPFFFPALIAGRGVVKQRISDAVKASLRKVAQ